VLLSAALTALALVAYSSWLFTDEAGDRGYIGWSAGAGSVIAAAALALRAILVRRERRAWALIAAGLASYSAATLMWILWLQPQDPPPYPSIADALWIAFYPAAYAGLVSIMRHRLPRLPRAVMLDGLIAGMAVAGVASVAMAPAAARNSQGLETLAQITTFAYPLLDIVLLAVIGFVFAVTGCRPGRLWALLAAAVAAITVADVVWSYQVAGLLRGDPATSNLLWTLAWILFAVAAWQWDGETMRRSEGWLATTVPVAFASAAVAVLVIDHYVRLNPAAVLLAAATCVLAMLRTVLTVAEERMLAESRRQALTDELTGLPNRRSFLGRLAETIEGAREEGTSTALLMIDLDRFKELNDTLGHAAGDDLLAALGPRLAESVGRQGRIARLGGDEFGVILPRTSCDRAEALGRALRAAIEQPFHVRGLRVSVGASAGIALYPRHAASGEELLQRADVAMYQAKRTGGGVEVYAADRDEHSRDRLMLASELRHAIQSDRLSVLYQPKARAHDGRPCAVEALVRWTHPSHGAIPPAQFVPVAEQIGLGRALTRRVLDHAVRQAAQWHDRGRPLRVAVNLCAADVADPGFPDDVASLLARWRLPAELLGVEVTENTVLADPVAAHAVLARLGELGVESSLDDFGTGHSSLTHLRRLPVREIKLDRSFVAGMVSDRQDATIVQSTVDLARRLGLRVVAEGVEDDATWMLLRDLGCDEIQGYLLSPPLTAAALDDWLADRERLQDPFPDTQAAQLPGR